jgi:heme/copper-type cytochrome/quinol oxidase subunit 2
VIDSQAPLLESALRTARLQLSRHSIGIQHWLRICHRDGQRYQNDGQEVRVFPNVIRAKRGDRIKLVITALDRDHGFKLEALHIDQKLPKGEAIIVEVTADRAGTFPFECSTFCGLGHKRMKGHLTVE